MLLYILDFTHDNVRNKLDSQAPHRNLLRCEETEECVDEDKKKILRDISLDNNCLVNASLDIRSELLTQQLY